MGVCSIGDCPNSIDEERENSDGQCPAQVVSDGSQTQTHVSDIRALLLVPTHPQEKNLSQVDGASSPLWPHHGIWAEMGLRLLEEVLQGSSLTFHRCLPRRETAILGSGSRVRVEFCHRGRVRKDRGGCLWLFASPQSPLIPLYFFLDQHSVRICQQPRLCSRPTDSAVSHSAGLAS